MPSTILAIGTGWPQHSSSLPHFGLFANAFPSRTPSHALSMLSARQGPSLHTNLRSNSPTVVVSASNMSDTLSRSDVTVSWALIVDVVGGSSSPVVLQHSFPSSSSSFDAVSCNRAAHSLSLSRPIDALDIQRLSPSTRKPSDP